jgi:hypothetical protein
MTGNSSDHKSPPQLETRIRVDRSNPRAVRDQKIPEMFCAVWRAGVKRRAPSDHPPAIWLITTHLTETRDASIDLASIFLSKPHFSLSCRG